MIKMVDRPQLLQGLELRLGNCSDSELEKIYSKACIQTNNAVNFRNGLKPHDAQIYQDIKDQASAEIFRRKLTPEVYRKALEDCGYSNNAPE